MLQNSIISADFIKKIMQEKGWSSIKDLTTIRQFNELAHEIEEQSGQKFIHMGIGNPGLPPAKAGMEEQIKAIEEGVPAFYPQSSGILKFKKAASQFIKDFLDLEIDPKNCIATVGSTQAAFLIMMAIQYSNTKRDTMLLLSPNFPVHQMQAKVLGINTKCLDISEYRGYALYTKLEEILKEGNIHSLLYSNPNNPTWTCLTDEELQLIGKLANKYGIIVIEDLAYFGMDFRKDYSQPGMEPFQPSVGKYTNNYVILISSSKSFSYPGERIGILAISNILALRKYLKLKKNWNQKTLWEFIVYIGIAVTTTSATHSAQIALSAIMESLHDNKYNYREDVLEYGRKAELMKKAFIDNGFYITYDKDCGEPIADGFYFTYSYPGFTGTELMQEMLQYGICGAPLSLFNSSKEGIRACTSLIQKEDIPVLAERLAAFAKDHTLV